MPRHLVTRSGNKCAALHGILHSLTLDLCALVMALREVSLRAVIVIAVVCSCSHETGPCADLEGTYSVVLEPRETCGARDESVRSVEREGGPYDGANCAGSYDRSADRCTYEYDVTCEARDPAGALIGAVDVTGISYASEDGSRLSGVESLCVYDADGLICCGTFDTTWTRL